jgi:DNA-binding transcriptional LysR family regulator
MELRQLKTFRTVAALLSFNRAAEQLHYAQSSISAQIQALEEELGVQLFDRLGRRILLTEAGERLIQYADKILDLADETQADIGNIKEPKGSLTIRVPESFGAHKLPLIIKRFQENFPKVRLYFTTCAHESLDKDLRKGITDLAFLLAESIQSGDLNAEMLGVESLVVVSHPNHPLAMQKSVETRELANEPLLLSRVDCSYRRLFEKALDHESVPRHAVLEFNSVEAIKQCVKAGVGITIIPETAIKQDLMDKKLAVIPWVQGKLEVAVLMIWYKEKWLSPTLKAFMEVTREVMQEAPLPIAKKP